MTVWLDQDELNACWDRAKAGSMQYEVLLDTNTRQEMREVELLSSPSTYTEKNEAVSEPQAYVYERSRLSEIAGWDDWRLMAE